MTTPGVGDSSSSSSLLSDSSLPSDSSPLPSGSSSLPSGSSALPSGSSSLPSGSSSLPSNSSSLPSGSSSLFSGLSPIPSDSSTSPDVPIPSCSLSDEPSAEKSGTGPWDIPIPTVSMTETSGQTYGCDNKTAEEHYRRLGRESMKSFLGPMPAEAFLDTFLHRDNVDRRRQPSSVRAFEKVPKHGTTEQRIYKPLTDALNFRSTTNNVRRCPNFTFWDTSVYADQSGPGGAMGSVKPDICCYPDTLLHGVGHPKSNPSARPAHMGFVAFWFEIKATEGQDFFTDPPDDTDNRDYWQFVLKGRDGIARTDAVRDLGQAVNYAAEASKRQHRHCCFSISLSGTSARFIRWDRAGAIVSKKFDIHERPELLCDFVWCFAHISDADRGYDLTVGPATRTEEKIFHKKIAAHICTQVDVQNASDLGRLLDEHSQKGSVTSIHLPEPAAPHANAKEGRRLLVSRPMVVPLSVAGRGTRAYWAYDETIDKGVENVPQVVYHGDVPQVLEVKNNVGEVRIRLLGSLWVCGRQVTDMSRIVVAKRYHYRMVLGVAGYTLLRLRGTAELLHAAYDAFRASKQAYEKANRLHRDISPGNIILVNPGVSVSHSRSRRGYLVDWDLSRDSERAGPREECEVSATWQFLAYEICANSHASNMEPPAGMSDEQLAQYKALHMIRHTIQHDMESILYVVMYCALLWCPHNGDGVTLRNILRAIFDYFQIRYTKTLQWHSRALQGWLTQVMDLHHPHRSQTANPHYQSTPGVDAPVESREWTPDTLDVLWRRILASHDAPTLSYNDRIDNIARYSEHFHQLVPHSALPHPHQPTQASPKRKRAHSQDEGAPEPKQARYSPQVDAPDDGSLGSVAQATIDMDRSTMSHSTMGEEKDTSSIGTLTRRRVSVGSDRTVRGSMEKGRARGGRAGRASERER
ncbi:hypothetical protein C8T65DRAFT_645396 [Cerioporus squamosus]|nr:hypothetical protein C8T65DRAFT_645396 [Cerioporus squamosus]